MNSLSLALDAHLEKLETAQLVRRADDPDLVCSFKQALTQETAYQSLLQNRRRRVHRLVAKAYEAAFPDRMPQYAAILPKHYSESGDDAKTLTFAHIAGDEAARVYANSLSRIETNSGNATEGRSLRHRARGIAQEIAAMLSPEPRDLFLRLSDSIFVLEGG